MLDIISDRIIACGAAVAAFMSALYAYNSNRISQKALDIASAEHELKKDNLEFYLVDSFKIRTKKESEKYIVLAFHTSITNKSLSPNGITRLDIEISFTRSDGSAGNYIFPHSPSYIEIISERELTPFSVPCSVPPKEAISGWAIFGFPQERLSGIVINKYSISSLDSMGKITSVTSYLIKEFI